MLLGNVDSTAISIKEANILPPYNFNSTIKRVNGYITNSICNEGSKRLINVSKHSPNLILINNIVGEILDVECTVIESGNYNLEIIDLLGNTTIIKEWTTDSTKDKFNFSIPIKNLDNGNYFVVMRTPTMRINKKFIIKR
ncbi:hypothetical protein SDC9_183174 [bioreactor metagenome]|uniref:Secretion system C-terminal sorting domain-containing protein n=1 Tax=bioreactor metagenome TaxID=1076179 RepID=A0A645HAY8_9ZZZZ